MVSIYYRNYEILPKARILLTTAYTGYRPNIGTIQTIVLLEAERRNYKVVLEIL